MIVGGYSLDLYCDAPKCENPYTPLSEQFVGESAQDCYKQARAVGWKLNLNPRNPGEAKTALCPLCAKKPHRKKKDPNP